MLHNYYYILTHFFFQIVDSVFISTTKLSGILLINKFLQINGSFGIFHIFKIYNCFTKLRQYKNDANKNIILLIIL